MRHRFLAGFGVLLLAACSGTGDDGDDSVIDAGMTFRDGGPIRDAGPVAPSLTVGTGRDAFISVTEGDELELIAGPQGGGRLGGHHIYVAIRIEGVAQDDLDLLTFTISSTNGEARATVQRNPAIAPIQRDPSTGALQLISINPIIDDCCIIASGEAVLGASADLKDGTTLSDDVRIRVSRCPGPSEPGPNLCP